ncbi:MAG: YcaQ family DNA glycosylase [Deltaproteobacteria bacterium]|nr:YcaQ family DNA glycosylase [Deltaproteobacteria bacterium]
MPLTLADLRRFAVARSLFAPTSLKEAIERLGFVQADPIRAPARAQDLTLRHRVDGYRAGDLERRYAELAIEEDAFINYGFLPRRHLDLMHPRSPRRPWDRATRRRATQVLEVVRERGEVHPREVDARLSLGTVTNYWGGSSSATTWLLEEMHYRGLLRVARRESGVRVYAPRDAERPTLGKRAQADALLALAVGKYGPVPGPSLGQLVSRLRYAAPQLSTELGAALQRAKSGLPRARVEGVDWYWPEGEQPAEAAPAEDVRLLAPFDPVVWDRRRFELFWGWAYRFEAYTPAPKRKLGYYALPLLFRDAVIGWANLTVDAGALRADFGWVARRPRDRAFAGALEAEVERVRAFLDL